MVVEVVAAEQQPVVAVEVYKYLSNLLLETQLIQLQLVEEELQDLMEILVVKEMIQ